MPGTSPSRRVQPEEDISPSSLSAPVTESATQCTTSRGVREYSEREVTAANTAPGLAPETSRPEETGAEHRLFELEQRYSDLCEELSRVEKELRRLRTAADLCPLCGGAGKRLVRGGLYGELQQRLCSCKEG